MAPTGLVAVTISSGRIDLSWSDNATTEDGFRIECSDDGGATFLEVAAVGPDVTTYVSLGQAPNSAYVYQVRAYNAGGNSAYTNTAGATTFNASWSGPLSTGPAGRSQHSAVYDTGNLQMVIFGGANLSGFLGDVWAFDSAGAWTDITPAAGPPAPAARVFHSAVYDSAFQRMVIFGGASPAPSNDVWTLDLSGGGGGWTLLTPTGGPPSARLRARAVYDPVGRRMILFGGSDGGNLLNDVWELSLTSAGGPFAWNALSPGGPLPLPRELHTSIYDGAAQRMIVFGGVDNDFTDGSPFNNEVWALTLPQGGGMPTWSLLSPAGAPPPLLQSHAAIYDSASQRMVVFSGFDNISPLIADAWSLGLSGPLTWTLLAPIGTPPAARMDHTGVYDGVNDRMILFGGNDLGGPPNFFAAPEPLGF